jgi:ubiquinone/menaquinone biosynthesis C-methylase UbiE
MITGINISDAQIADARALAPSCTFQVMNATKLDFPHNHFDAARGRADGVFRWV